MTLTQAQQSIGKYFKIQIENLIVDVVIKAAKPAFGRVDVLVSPVSGSGQQWVNSNRLLK